MIRRLFAQVTNNWDVAGGTHRAEVVVVYEPDRDPFQASLVIKLLRVPQVYTWRFPRRLIADGLIATEASPAGESGPGGVRAWTVGTSYVLELNGDGDHAGCIGWLWFDRPSVEPVAAVIHAEVPIGEEVERIDWDVAISRILDGAER